MIEKIERSNTFSLDFMQDSTNKILQIKLMK